MDLFAAVADQLEQAYDTTDPVAWVGERTGEHVWSKQADIMNAVAEHRRVAVRSCHGVGKSHIASRIVAWWLDSHPAGEAFVVTSAPTFAQVRAILWRYIRQIHRRANLPGKVNQTEWLLSDELVAFGRKPADHDEAAFQGIHARYVLVVLDEACGIPEQLWYAADSLTTNDDCRMLAIGNPDNPQSYFARVCSSSSWHTIGISAYDSPNMTGEVVPESLTHLLVSKTWIEEKAREWGRDNPIYISKVLGQFPPDDPNSVVRASDVALCRIGSDMQLAAHELLPVELGVDVGGGGDETVIRERRGPLAGREWRHQSDRSEEIAPLILHALRETGATAVKVDRIGVGAGLIGELRNMLRDGLHSARIVAVNVAEKAHDEIRFANLRAQIWWEIGRINCERRLWDLSGMDNADTTCAQLLAPRWTTDTKGRILIERKDDVIARLGRSPDNADALLLAFYTPRGDLTDWFDQLAKKG